MKYFVLCSPHDEGDWTHNYYFGNKGGPCFDTLNETIDFVKGLLLEDKVHKEEGKWDYMISVNEEEEEEN